MTVSTQWQLADDAAKRYQDILVPALLGPAARMLVRHAAIRPGEAVLDVGCGTGEAARCAAVAAGRQGQVMGIDVNPGMLAAARAIAPAAGAPIQWGEGNAERLPIDSGCMDVVLCAQTLQVVPDRAAAAREMRRVLRPGRRVAVSAWTGLEDSPYFSALLRAIGKHLGAPAAAAISAVFGLADAARLAELLGAAGFGAVSVRTVPIGMNVAPLQEFVPRDFAGHDPSATPVHTHIALGAVA